MVALSVTTLSRDKPTKLTFRANPDLDFLLLLTVSFLQKTAKRHERFLVRHNPILVLLQTQPG